MKKCGGVSHDSCNRLSRSDGGVIDGDRSVSGLSSLFASGWPVLPVRPRGLILMMPRPVTGTSQALVKVYASTLTGFFFRHKTE